MIRLSITEKQLHMLLDMIKESNSGGETITAVELVLGEGSPVYNYRLLDASWITILDLNNGEARTSVVVTTTDT